MLTTVRAQLEACVESVSERVITRESLLSLIVLTFSTNSRGNACYASYPSIWLHQSGPTFQLLPRADLDPRADVVLVWNGIGFKRGYFGLDCVMAP